jgi:alkaline phosphatase D
MPFSQTIIVRLRWKPRNTSFAPMSRFSFSCTILLLLFSCCFLPLSAQRKPRRPTEFVHLNPHAPYKDRAMDIQRIAFGSCAHHEKAQPLLDSARLRQPDLFIYLGDNIYGDTRDMTKLRSKYAVLSSKPEFQRLWNSTRILATWDDHDYGENDAGRYFPKREASKEIFLDFWDEPKLSARRLHPGIYHAEEFGPPHHRVQVILLDTRSFRDDLVQSSSIGVVPHYLPNPNPDSTFLGTHQWHWLEDQLRKPAQVRIIASSNQFSQTHSGYESWANVPHERAQMLALIRKTKAEGVIFISGDVHYGELSIERSDSLYPIHDLTSSGITQSWSKVSGNGNRIGEAVVDNNFGMIEIDWDAQLLWLVLTDAYGKERIRHKVAFSEIGN